ncbi:MAG: STAS domain-containing protein [Paracoccaceae bacterium]
MGKTWHSFALDSNWSQLDDRGLRTFLIENQHADVRLDASQLRKLDTGLVELLLSAAQSWAGRGLSLHLSGLGPLLIARLDLMGLRDAFVLDGASA